MAIEIDISDSDGLQWEGGGYLHRVSQPSELKLPNDVSSQPLAAFAIILAQCKNGQFDHVERLFEIREATLETQQKLAYLATMLLGDAGTTATYERMIAAFVPDCPDYEMVIDYCNALSMRGWLADVPIMLRAYRDVAYARDAEAIACWISDVLCPRPDRIGEGSSEADFDDYETLVLERYETLVQQFGTDQLRVLKGERFSPRMLCRLIKERIREPFFDLNLRRRFEAMSGFDCAGCFKDSRLQHLSFAELVERFLDEELDNPDLDANIRLFFRHRISG